MHFVDRGPEPPSLAAIRERHTPRWVEFYRDPRGKRPADAHWRRFQPALSGRFHSICGYCEECCAGHVDHFRPKSRFPQRVYAWENWVLACPFCNQSKSEYWPACGYVDPCARSTTSRPERHFNFDTVTGEMIAQTGLSDARRDKAARMISDLRLNAYHHLKNRTQWLAIVDVALARLDDDARATFARVTAARTETLSSITRALLRERGVQVDAD